MLKRERQDLPMTLWGPISSTGFLESRPSLTNAYSSVEMRRAGGSVLSLRSSLGSLTELPGKRTRRPNKPCTKLNEIVRNAGEGYGGQKLKLKLTAPTRMQRHSSNADKIGRIARAPQGIVRRMGGSTMLERSVESQYTEDIPGAALR